MIKARGHVGCREHLGSHQHRASNFKLGSLQKLFSLLNFLLPKVLDNLKAFHDWFSKPFLKDAPSHSSKDDWIETEKKVIIIHGLH